MSTNRGVVYVKPGVVAVEDIADPKFEDPQGRKIDSSAVRRRLASSDETDIV